MQFHLIVVSIFFKKELGGGGGGKIMEIALADS